MSVELAERYVVVSKGRAWKVGGDAWQEYPGRDFEVPEAAIEFARWLLDNGEARAVVVQGRGTRERPTPPGQTEIYRGVGPGLNAKAFFPTMNRDEIEIRLR